MTDTNSVRHSLTTQSAFRTPVSTPRMRTGRVESFELKPTIAHVQSNEIVSDGMRFDPVFNFNSSAGQIKVELRYPNDNGFLEELLESAFCANFVKTPTRDNDGVADAVISNVAAATGIVTVSAGSTFFLGQLALLSGFANAANNGFFRATTASSATVPAFASQGLVDELVPPAAARIDVVGVQGASGEIAATATGLTSTNINFLNCGFVPGMHVYVGDLVAGAAFQFNTAANNGICRVSAVAANALTFDIRPAGWAIDAGTGKTIRVFMPDYLRNGRTRKFMTFESSSLAQSTPTHIVMTDVMAGGAAFDFNGEFITATFDMVGGPGSQSTTAFGASYDAIPSGVTMTSKGSLKTVLENGTLLAGTNEMMGLSLSITNSPRPKPALGYSSHARIGIGYSDVTGQGQFYFDDNALIDKMIASTRTSLIVESRAPQPSGTGTQGVVISVPRVTLTGDMPGNPGANEDQMFTPSIMASRDPSFSLHMQFERFRHTGRAS